MTRHVPDIRVVPCLGCGEPIRDTDLFKHERHGGVSCCLWHPYHFWCAREGPPPAHDQMACAECHVAFELERLHATLRWSAASTHVLHQRTISVTPPAGVVHERQSSFNTVRPPGVRLVVIVEPYGYSQFAVDRFELAHDDCPARDEWRARLRDDPDRNATRAVYADWLEQTGEVGRAEFVRVAIRREHAERVEHIALDRELRERRRDLPGSFCRDVCERAMIHP